MSYPYPNLNSYQTSNPNPPQQPGQYIQPGQFVQPGQPLPNAYNDAGQQAYSYPEGSFQPQSSGQRHSSRSPNVGNINIPFPEPHGGSAGHPQVYFPPSQTTPNLAVPTHIQHGRRGSHGNSPTGSYSDRQGLYSASVGSDTGSGSNFYSPQSGVQPQNYAAIAPQPQAVYDEGHDSRLKGPAPGPVRGTQYMCRFPRCGRNTFIDRRVNERREWCSDQHMLDAVTYGVEKPCNICRVWPRLNGFKRCSGNDCRYPRQY